MEFGIKRLICSLQGLGLFPGEHWLEIQAQWKVHISLLGISFNGCCGYLCSEDFPHSAWGCSPPQKGNEEAWFSKDLFWFCLQKKKYSLDIPADLQPEGMLPPLLSGFTASQPPRMGCPQCPQCNKWRLYDRSKFFWPLYDICFSWP